MNRWIHSFWVKSNQKDAKSSLTRAPDRNRPFWFESPGFRISCNHGNTQKCPETGPISTSALYHVHTNRWFSSYFATFFVTLCKFIITMKELCRFWHVFENSICTHTPEEMKETQQFGIVILQWYKQRTVHRNRKEKPKVGAIEIYTVRFLCAIRCSCLCGFSTCSALKIVPTSIHSVVCSELSPVPSYKRNWFWAVLHLQ